CLLRRLSPDCSRIELTSLPTPRDDARLLRAMGWEAGNIHLGTRGAGKAILGDLKRRKPAWLREAATKMGRLVRADWKEGRAGRETHLPTPRGGRAEGPGGERHFPYFLLIRPRLPSRSMTARRKAMVV